MAPESKKLEGEGIMAYQCNQFYLFDYSPLWTEPYWPDLYVPTDKNQREYSLVLCFKTNKGYIIGEFVDPEEVLLNQVKDQAMEVYSFDVLIPIKENHPFAFYFKSTFSKQTLVNFFEKVPQLTEYITQINDLL
ncbi:hypothetical protein KI123_002496 [Enterococcus faecalis]|nr:hypothetical protein [Enterococcus faecalis]